MNNATIQLEERNCGRNCRPLPVWSVEQIRVVLTEIEALRQAS